MRRKKIIKENKQETNKKQKAPKDKRSIKEIMEDIIDQDELDKAKKEREERKKKRKQKEKEKEVKIEEKPKQWWELPLKKEDFIIKLYDKQYFVKYKEWKDTIWSGPYPTRKEANMIIDLYVNESLKRPIDRNLDGVHSIIIDINGK